MLPPSKTCLFDWPESICWTRAQLLMKEGCGHCNSGAGSSALVSTPGENAFHVVAGSRIGHISTVPRLLIRNVTPDSSPKIAE